jgi:hypothetical protein
MIRLIEECMQNSTFPFTTELLKDSLRLYLSAYGQVADNEVMTFDACDCIDERRRKPLYHDPCEKVSSLCATPRSLSRSLAVPRSLSRSLAVPRSLCRPSLCYCVCLLCSRLL